MPQKCVAWYTLSAVRRIETLANYLYVHALFGLALLFITIKLITRTVRLLQGLGRH